MRATSALALGLLLVLPAFVEAQPAGQRRWLSYDEAFVASPRAAAASESAPLAPLPVITGWRDDEHYLERRDGHMMAVRASDGVATRHEAGDAFSDVLPEGLNATNSDAESTDGRLRVYLHENDLWLLDTGSKRFRRLTETPGAEQNPTLSPDDRQVAYTREGNLFTYDLAGAAERQLTIDGSDTILNGYASWVYYEEILGRSSRYKAFWWSPDSRRLAFLRFDDGPVPVFPIFWADGPHGRLEEQRYPKAGDPNPLVRVGVVDAAGGAPRWMEMESAANEYLAWPSWTPDAGALIVQAMNRDQTALRFYRCDPATGAARQIFEERQPSWVSWVEDLTFLENGNMILRSDVDGWDHLYELDADGQQVRRLTSGTWRVRSIVAVDEDAGWLYLMAQPGPDGPSWNTELRRMRLDGTGLETVTKEPGTHSVRMAPAAKMFLTTVSSVDAPARLLLYRTDGTLVREVASARSAVTATVNWGQTELFTYPSGDGYDLRGMWVKPPDFDPARKYPVLVSVYGGPDAGTVRNAWASNVAHYWAQRGVIWVALDHRGSGHHGKAGVAQMHRRLGHWEMHDYLAAAAWLKTQPFVDGHRLGIYGGSYGGYVTMLALTRGSDAFTAGQANAAVTDWRLYDTVYTERYMDTPADNPDGYRDGAVLTWIDRYKGGLRITHGSVDDNVHLQNSLQVVDWLTEHDKAFDLMIYPDSRHALQGSQRRHAARESHAFWVARLLGGKLPADPAADTAPATAVTGAGGRSLLR